MSQLRLVDPQASIETDPTAVAELFDSNRLTQARRLAGMTKKAVADELGISAAAVGQWEAGVISRPRPHHVVMLAELLDVRADYFLAGRPHARLDAGDAHFRSLRSMPARDRDKALSFVEEVWELTHALHKRVNLPTIDPAGVFNGDGRLADLTPEEAAREVRQTWGMGTTPVAKMVRTLERRGVIVTMASFSGSQKVDAFSTSHLPRPIVVVTPNKYDDVYRHRFTVAHELGHLVMHGDVKPGDMIQEKEANAFAAEFLTPRSEIEPRLPSRMDLRSLNDLSREWGVSVDSLIYRCKEVGVVSENAYRRAFQRLAQRRATGLFDNLSLVDHPGERPVVLRQAFDLAEANGTSYHELAAELKWTVKHLRAMLGEPDRKPSLHIQE